MAAQTPCTSYDPSHPENRQPADCIPYSAPVQVTRLVPVESTANAVNAYVWSLLPTDSVFNYYRLIDVQWPNNSVPVPAGARTPLSNGDITPKDSTRIVANTTLETFVQQSSSCMDCHQGAPISSQSQTAVVSAFKHLNLMGIKAPRTRLPVAGVKEESQAPYASYYSFIFIAKTDK